MRGFRKFSNVPTFVGARRFASKAEAARYGELRTLEHAGAIRDLECQPRYRLEVNGIFVCSYTADFRYFDKQLARQVVEDVKGVQTQLFKVKMLLARAVLGLEVKLIGRARRGRRAPRLRLPPSVR